MASVKVKIWEYERGFGRRLEDVEEFPFSEEGLAKAEARVIEINAPLGSLPTVPDSYFKAELVTETS